MKTANAPIQAPAPEPARNTLRQAQKNLTRERLIDAAVAVFEERGYRASTVEQIAQGAGANRATFYLHFKAKGDIAHAIAQRALPETAQMWQELDSAPQISVADVRRWIDLHMDFSQRNREWAAIQIEILNSEPTLSGLYLEYADHYTVQMKHLLQRLGPKERENARSKLLYCFMLIERFCFFSAIHGHQLPGADPRGALAEFLWQGVFSGQPLQAAARNRKAPGRRSQGRKP